MTQDLLWQASTERKQASNMQAFLERANSEYSLNLSSYAELHQWSVEQREAFWSLLWRYAQVEAQTPYDSVLSNGDKMPGASWFEGARLNFAENLLAPANNSDLANKAALVFRNEDPDTRVEISYAELYLQVAKAARAMRALGVVAGDRVAAFMPNCPQTLIGMLAATSIGAVFSSCSPDFGIQGVLDRFGQIKPKLLLATQGYLYAGKKIDCGERVQAIAESLNLDAEQLISVPYVGLENEFAQPEQSILWSDFLNSSLNNDASDIDFEALPFDHPLYIMYSSGTTGVPKCIVHGAGGTLLQHKKELLLHTDVKADDVLFYFTTCGWMMWNWLVSGLSTGATVLLFDGSPFHQDGEANPEVMWNIAQQEGITIFGTSAKYISALEKAGVKPAASHEHKVRTLLSTGSPLAHESFDYVYRDIAVESDGQADLALCSISGGTDIISCFALGNPLLPVYRGELQCFGLGMDVQTWNDDGSKSNVGEKGELVCAQAFPSMPVGFWNDDCSEIPYGQKYHNAYFDQFTNVWAHGDYAEVTPHGGLIIHGRSDAVLNPGGVRIGTAEIYRQVEKLDEVVESLAIGQQWQDDVRVVLFVVLSKEALASGLQNNEMTDELRQKIRQQIRANCTPRHVPAKVIAVPELPRTISGKLVELAVRNVVHGDPVKNTDALANPQALAHFKDIEELAHD
ncbi:acetoacetate--CoA ligase [Bacterioplanoides sp.]|uniref:acetoacetate--CoA ligase n=1 Tax=Bacterioplanoides sp. TaxID=2066072 RepID=UPI003B5B0849